MMMFLVVSTFSLYVLYANEISGYFTLMEILFV